MARDASTNSKHCENYITIESSALYIGFDSRGRHREEESPTITGSPTGGEENDHPALAQTSTSHHSTMARDTKECLFDGKDNCKTPCKNEFVFGFVGAWHFPLWMDRQTDKLVTAGRERCFYLFVCFCLFLFSFAFFSFVEASCRVHPHPLIWVCKKEDLQKRIL